MRVTFFNWALILVILLSLSACGPKKPQKTLAVLEDKTVDIKIDKQVSVDHSREKAMNIYKEFEKGESDPSLRLEAKRRLADLEMEKGEDAFVRSRPGIDTAGKDPEATKQESYKNAIKLYKELLSVNKGSPNNHRILYQLAKAYESSGQSRKSLETINHLVSVYPNISYKDEVQFRRGEISFLLGDYNQAADAYFKVLSLGEFTLFYEKALYKRGWALFKLNRYEDALTPFFQLLDRKMLSTSNTIEGIELTGLASSSAEKRQNGSRADAELIKDVLRVVNLALGYLDSAESIKAYFDKAGHRSYEYRLYQSLGDFYLSQERIQDAAEVFLAYTKHYAKDPRAPFFYIKMMQAYKQGGYESLLFKAKFDFVERYAVSSEYWRTYSAASRKKLLPYLKLNMAEVARHYHAKAQKTKSERDYDQTIRWYKSYMKTFPKDPALGQINFLLAEATYEKGDYANAVTEYEKVAYSYRRFDKSAEAAYAALLAYDRQEKKLAGKDKANWHRLSIGSALRFGKVFSKDKRASQVVIKVAEDLFTLKKMEQAAEAARQVLEMKPQASAEARLSAWAIIAHTAFDKEDYIQAEVSYNVALSLVPEGAAMESELREGLAAALYKQGEILRKNGDMKKAISQFAKIRQVAPDSDINASAAYDVASSYIEAQNWAKAIPAFKSFRKSYPRSELAEDATQNMIVAYMKLDKPESAAQELELLAGMKEDPEFKRKSILQMAELYKKAGNQDKELSAYKKYVALYPNPYEKAMFVRENIANVYKDRGASKDYYYWLNQIVSAQGSSAGQGTDQTAIIAAKASYTLALPSYDAYSSVALVVPLQQSLKLKRSKMKQALDAFTRAADYGVPEVTTAATYHIAKIYGELASNMLDSERPSDLSGDALEQYEILLEEQAFPFEEKAIEIHESNTSLTQKGHYDQWVQKSFSELTKLLPIRYAKAERKENYFDVTQ